MSSQEKDLIRLAEAMWGPCTYNCTDDEYEIGCSIHDRMAFNPFKDANDDYEVLKWMRENFTPIQKLLARSRLLSRYEMRDSDLPSRYTMGDYARASLAILNNSEKQ